MFFSSNYSNNNLHNICGDKMKMSKFSDETLFLFVELGPMVWVLAFGLGILWGAN